MRSKWGLGEVRQLPTDFTPKGETMITKEKVLELKALINLYKKSYGISNFKLSYLIGISEPTIGKIQKEDTNIKPQIVEKVERYFEIYSLNKIVDDMSEAFLTQIYSAVKEEMLKRNIRYITNEQL